VFGWGVPTFVVFALLPAYRAVPWFSFVAVNPSVTVPVGALVWLGGGYAVGLWMWKTVEKRYAELSGPAGK
jgi:hypothetical protein